MTQTTARSAFGDAAGRPAVASEPLPALQHPESGNKDGLKVMDIEINTSNKEAIVAELVRVAGRATYTTIRDWDGFERAFKKVLTDLERRFRVPVDVDLKAIFTRAGGTALVTELTFRRASGVWYLRSVRKKRSSSPVDYIKYVVGAYSYEKFRVVPREVV